MNHSWKLSILLQLLLLHKTDNLQEFNDLQELKILYEIENLSVDINKLLFDVDFKTYDLRKESTQHRK